MRRFVFVMVASLLATPAVAKPRAYAGHGAVMCDADGEPLTCTVRIDGQDVEGQDFSAENFGTTVVRLYTDNGRPASEGVPLCNASGCALHFADDVPPSQYSCRADTPTVVHVQCKVVLR